MKFVMCFGLATAILLPPPGQSSPGKLERISVGGTEHIRLEDWALANNFQARWTIPKQELKLTGNSSTLLFTVDSAKMSLNGIYIWLSAPIALRNTSVWIAAVDLKTAIEPVLFPVKNAASRTIRNIVLDPGHGGKDPGNFESGAQEKRYTLLLAKEVGDLLNQAGLKASLTRTSDTFLELPTRPDLARRRGADLFVSLHFNSADGAGASAVKGVEVYCMTPARTSSTNARGEGAGAGSYPGNRFDAKNMLLGYEIQKALVTHLPAEDRGVRRARFAVLRSVEMPAVLIEGGFMTNPGDSRKIYDSAQRHQMAEAIVAGVKAYKNLVEQPDISSKKRAVRRETTSAFDVNP